MADLVDVDRNVGGLDILIIVNLRRQQLPKPDLRSSPRPVFPLCAAPAISGASCATGTSGARHTLFRHLVRLLFCFCRVFRFK